MNAKELDVLRKELIEQAKEIVKDSSLSVREKALVLKNIHFKLYALYAGTKIVEFAGLENMQEFFTTFNIPSPAGSYGGLHNKSSFQKAPGNTTHSSNTLDQVMKEIEKNYEANGLHAGTAPGWGRKFKASGEKIIPPFVDVLRHFAKKTAGYGRHTSYSPPNKKRWQLTNETGVILPSRKDKTLTVGVVIDTSGSMNDSDLNKMIRALKGVFTTFHGPKMVIGFNDADNYEFNSIENRADFNRFIKKIEKDGVKGGGGSIFKDVFFDRALNNVDIMLFFSDFFIFLPEDKQIKIPTVLIPTPVFDSSVLKTAKNKIFKKSIVYKLSDV